MLPYTIIAVSHVGDLVIGASKHPLISLAEATKWAKKGLKLDDSYSGTYFTLGFIAFARQKHEKAIALAEKTIALNPNSAIGYFLLCLAFTHAGMPDEGIDYLRKTLRLNPKPQGNYFLPLCLAYWLLGQNEKAAAMCKKTIDQAPDAIIGWCFLTAIYISSGQEENANAAAKEVLRIDPDFSVERFAKNRPFKNESDRKKSIAALRKAGLN